jgi:hypothetical protein
MPGDKHPFKELAIPMEFGSGCLICGDELLYFNNFETLTCFYCGVTKETNASCRNGHYVCDACHNGTANDLIERYCSRDASASPVFLAMTLMKNPAVKMHGPEHHFLVAAVLLAAFHAGRNAEKSDVAEKIREARKRAEEVKGGFCGFQGACGAAIGAGIFMSLITGATPLSDRERKLSNMITAECLMAIADNGGARCCKRESFRAIITAVEFVRRELGVVLPVEMPACCSFTDRNRECLRERCAFHGVEQKTDQNTSHEEK